ncbi:MAG: hypothetical protein AAF494_02065 [Pseudomonadota bacterium]
MRQIGCLFFVLTFLAGITVSTPLVALINVVVFLVLALAVAQFLEPRFGSQGLVYGMAGAFFASFLWPFLLIPFIGEDGCEGDQCLAGIFTTPGARVSDDSAS